jgi:hypothetical protein
MATSDSKGVFLDSSLTASQARISPEVKHILIDVLKEAIIVVIHEYFYRIDFGPGVHPQLHIVSHDLYCTCALEADCPSVVAVKVYLRDGGKPAKTPDPGYFPAAPIFCPVCGARACYAPELSSRHRGIGWKCSKFGGSHYWQHQGSIRRSITASKYVS